jgi:hypothetical protein
MQGGGYLNTIESEGNIPSQKFGTNQIQITTGGNDNNKSRKNISF